jgi:hypothetical protein
MPNGLLSSDNPYSCRDEIEQWLAWDTAWHKLALEVAKTRRAKELENLGACNIS